MEATQHWFLQDLIRHKMHVLDAQPCVTMEENTKRYLAIQNLVEQRKDLDRFRRTTKRRKPFSKKPK